MGFKRGLTAIALCLGALTAHAGDLDNDLGAIDAGETVSFQESSASGNFFDIYSFELTSAGGLSGSFEDVSGVTLFSVKLASDGTYRWAQVGNDMTFSYDYLPVGYYALYVFGSATDGIGGYSGTLSAQPVPEPETYALLLAGLGVIGAAATRRRKSVK